MSRNIKIQAVHQSDKLAHIGDGNFPTDFIIEPGKPKMAEEPVFESFNAIVDLVRNELGTVIEVQVTFLGKVEEPQEAQELWVEIGPANEEGHPENERNEARIAALFGIKKYG